VRFNGGAVVAQSSNALVNTIFPEVAHTMDFDSSKFSVAIFYGNDIEGMKSMPTCPLKAPNWSLKTGVHRHVYEQCPRLSKTRDIRKARGSYWQMVMKSQKMSFYNTTHVEVVDKPKRTETSGGDADLYRLLEMWQFASRLIAPKPDLSRQVVLSDHFSITQGITSTQKVKPLQKCDFILSVGFPSPVASNVTRWSGN
jgi:hypothetical protein